MSEFWLESWHGGDLDAGAYQGVPTPHPHQGLSWPLSPSFKKLNVNGERIRKIAVQNNHLTLTSTSFVAEVAISFFFKFKKEEDKASSVLRFRYVRTGFTAGLILFSRSHLSALSALSSPRG